MSDTTDSPSTRRSARLAAAGGEGDDDASKGKVARSQVSESRLTAADSSFKQTIQFPKWDDSKRLDFSQYEMRVRAFATRSGHRSVFDVIDGLYIVGDFPDTHIFHVANEAYYCDLVLNVTGQCATEQLQAATSRLFTEAWPLLQREFGATSSLRKMEIIRNLVTLNMNDTLNDITQYKAKAMELRRQVMTANIDIDDIITYSIIYGLDHNYDAYKLMAQDKMDRGELGGPDAIIQGLTNSGEVITGTRNIRGSELQSNGKYAYRINSTNKPTCEHCGKGGHTKEECFDLNPHLLEEFRAKRKAKRDEEKNNTQNNQRAITKTNKVVRLCDVMTQAKNLNQGQQLSLDQLKTIVNSATDL